MLLEIGIGDAYGAGFEFSPREKVETYNNLSQYCEHELGIAPGCYTDDTQMSLAIAELIISDEAWTKENLANKFVECFKRDERLGYSKGFYSFLHSISSGEEFLRKMKPQSTRNGAAMRSAPLGYVDNITKLLEMAELQASLTHDTEIGRKSSQAVALASHYAIYNLGAKENLTEFVSQYTKYNWRENWSAPVACCAEETVHALLTVLRTSESLKDVLVNSVAFSGDVDTVAAVGLGIASRSKEYCTGLPSFLIEELESGKYGKVYLEEIGRQLSEFGDANKAMNEDAKKRRLL
ncbi:ADP-ribosylglycohydrolase family protein [Microbulbifer variabilis]|uniref:ADP-ribosylglycohydrolase family protein n=1 Tax=Microbulbifer variabilis TaxID=266805 RepID=A0ABY4VF92_9GAMM|nr:ADP-ribosylglycohydrolase family protein [Microbulbifer variabilis]USD22782.1 ADP-ribosylglycohydrolase family protein [Microbulbifer variabilis]